MKLKETLLENAILKRELATGKKQEAPRDAKTNKELERAVKHFIEKKRHKYLPADRAPSLQDRRSHDKEVITAVIKEHRNLLVPFDHVMQQALKSACPSFFLALRAMTAFTDGFRVNSTLFARPQGLQRYLKDFDLHTTLPGRANRDGYRFVQLAEGPYDLRHNLSLLREAAMALRQRLQQRDADVEHVCLQTFDATRDVSSTFFVLDDWRKKHKELQ